MKFRTPGQLESYFKEEEGFRNPNDREGWFSLSDYAEKIKKLPANIDVRGNPYKLVEEGKKHIQLLERFCNDLSDQFRNTFFSLIEEYKERKEIPQKIIDFLEKKNLTLPKFTIAHGRHAKELLIDIELYDESGEGEEGDEYVDNDFVLVFQLPTHLARLWWKGGANDWGEGGVDINDTFIEWGFFYRKLMPIVWEKLGEFENEYGIDFRRINDIGQHDPEKYYYAWYTDVWDKDYDYDK